MSDVEFADSDVGEIEGIVTLGLSSGRGRKNTDKAQQATCRRMYNYSFDRRPAEVLFSVPLTEKSSGRAQLSKLWGKAARRPTTRFHVYP